MDMVKRWFIALAAAILWSTACGQEVLLPLQSVPHSPAPKVAKGGAVALPFFDDFAAPAAMSALWEPGGATVGIGYGELPPTIGMATLDALDANGDLYEQASTSPFPADTLLSRPIRLDALTVADSVVLSFFYLPGGGSGNLWERIGDTPDDADTLYLDFYRPADSTWVNVWARGGVSVDTLLAHTGKAWQYVTIGIRDGAYLDSAFRFRFRNHCSLDATQKKGMRGNCDQWNIDYVLLDTARSVGAAPHWRDVAFVTPAPSLLARYQAMPARQYRTTDMASTMQLTIANLYSDDLASHYTYTIVDADGDTAYSYDGGFENAPADGYQTMAAHATPPVGYTIPEGTSHRTYTVTHVVREGTGGDGHPHNDTVHFSQVLADYYAYDDGSAENGYGLTSTASRVYLACRYDLAQADTISTVDLYFNRTADGENESIMFYLTVWQTGDDGRPGTILYQDNERRRPNIDGLNRYQRYVLENPTVVQGSVFVGFEQVGNDFINLGFDRHTESTDRIFYLTSTEWQQSILRGSLMLRPLFGTAATMGITGDAAQKAEPHVYPNPASDLVVIDGLPQGSVVQLYDMTGRRLLTTSHTKLSTTHLGNGLYLLRAVTPDGTSLTTKIIIRH